MAAGVAADFAILQRQAVKLGIVLATYNEASNLARLVEDLEALPVAGESHIFVVDDSSPDGTTAVAEELATSYGNVSVIVRPRRMGLGSALRDGIKAALEDDCSHVLTMDADRSHDPRDVPKLLIALETEGADLVQGSRFVKGGGTRMVGWRQRAQSFGANLLLRAVLGSPREATTNFRVYSRRAAQLMVAETRGRDFEFQPECILLAKRSGLRIAEVPIIFTGRAGGKSKLGLARSMRYAVLLCGSLLAFKLRLGRFSRRIAR